MSDSPCASAAGIPRCPHGAPTWACNEQAGSSAATDANCYTMPNGECVSVQDCLHGPATWTTFALLPSLKRCAACDQDVQGRRIGVRPNVEGAEGMVIRSCSNCGHLTTMGPILPSIADLWPGGGHV